MRFEIKARQGRARRGVLFTAHGEVETPAFMPVGTYGSVQALDGARLRETGAEILLSNAFHLGLRPGGEEIGALGGLHRFMNWDGAILTDSGGYQVLSLERLRRIGEEGVEFRSPFDGSRHFVTPESIVETQGFLGSDIMMPLDICLANPAPYEAAKEAMERSLVWSRRSRKAFERQGEGEKGRGLFGIVQGGTWRDLRAASAEKTIALGFEGYAIGSLGVGEGEEAFLETLGATATSLPEEKPRYLMGVGRPSAIIEAVRQGVDMFDCVIPTREARHGRAWTAVGRVNIKNACFADDGAPLDAGRVSPAARDYSRAYLHHLFKTNPSLAAHLLTWNNLDYYQRLMASLRSDIAEGRLAGESLLSD